MSRSPPMKGCECRRCQQADLLSKVETKTGISRSKLDKLTKGKSFRLLAEEGFLLPAEKLDVVRKT